MGPSWPPPASIVFRLSSVHSCNYRETSAHVPGKNTASGMVQPGDKQTTVRTMSIRKQGREDLADSDNKTPAPETNVTIVLTL